MFWRFGGYANISTLDTILDKPDVTLEELLDESDLIQELKQHNSKLIEYLRDEKVLQRLLEYVVAPSPLIPEDDEDEDEGPQPPKKKTFSPVRSLSIGRSKEQKEKSRKQEEREDREKADTARKKYAFVASEVLSSETWSILEAVMENQHHLRKFWEFLRRDAPLDPNSATYFTKINETLLDKKTEETLEFIKSLDGIIPAMLTHVDCPMVMDLLLKIISMEKMEGGQGIVDWLQSQDLMPRLLSYLGRDHPSFTQTAAGDFIKAIITISANASQNEQSCIGPNSLTRQLVSETCMESLVTEMLRGGNPLTVGVGIIIEVIRKNNSDYDPDVGAGQDSPPTSNDPIYLGTLLRMFAKHVPDFTQLILSPNHTVTNGDATMVVKRKELPVAFGGSIEPLGFDRFKTCELMAELLHCSNMGLLNERGSEAYVKQRDLERERLRSEQVNLKNREPQSAVTDFSEGSASFQNELSPRMFGKNSTEETRRLEVANSAEDDGFEDVGISADIADDIKDDFDDKSPFDLESNIIDSPDMSKFTRPRLDLDEEFFDEPLTSPRLEAIDEKEAELLEPPQSLDISDVEPSSSIPVVEASVKRLSLDGKPAATHGQTETPAVHLEPGEPSQQPSQETSASTSSSDAPPLPHRDRSLNVDFGELNPGSLLNLSPHPDDKPPPLFANRSEVSPANAESKVQASLEHMSTCGNSQETIDTTLGEEGDSNRSVLLAGSEPSFAPHIEDDVDGKPIVGDFLKMMFVEHQVVPTILDFFFRFPWNNFLHNVVYDVVQQVFNGPMDRGYNRSLAIDLFQTGRITERIIEGQLRSDEAQVRSNMRLGYMGHLTLIAEEVVKFSERHPAEVLSHAVLGKVTDKVWSDYVENQLTETRERDAAILGGVRPDVSGGPRQAVLNAVNAAHGFSNGGSSVLASVGLNGTSPGLDSMDLANNSGPSSGTFGLTGGSLLSGFGSSSDDEDEEMEDAGEHDDGAEGNTDQYPTYQPSSLSALSIFSPPLENNAPNSSSDANGPIVPPLNVPPSRARRQLAVQLALHGKTSPFTSPQASPEVQDPHAPNATTQPLTSPQQQKDIVDAAIEGHKSETPFGDLTELRPSENGGGPEDTKSTDAGMAAVLRELYPETFNEPHTVTADGTTISHPTSAKESLEVFSDDIPIAISLPLHPPPPQSPPPAVPSLSSSSSSKFPLATATSFPPLSLPNHFNSTSTTIAATATATPSAQEQQQPPHNVRDQMSDLFRHGHGSSSGSEEGSSDDDDEDGEAVGDVGGGEGVERVREHADGDVGAQGARRIGRGRKVREAAVRSAIEDGDDE